MPQCILYVGSCGVGFGVGSGVFFVLVLVLFASVFAVLCWIMACVSLAGLHLCWVSLVGCHGVCSPWVGLSLCCLFCCWWLWCWLECFSGLFYCCVVLAVVAWVSEVLCVGHGFVLVSFVVGLISVCFLLLAAVVLVFLVLAVAVLSVLVFSVVVLAGVFASVCSLCWQLWCWLWCWLWCILCVGVGAV